MEQTEREIQHQCFEYLERIGVMVWMDRQVAKKPGYGTFRQKAKGIPDILGITKDGRGVAVEVKKLTGEISQTQFAFLSRFQNFNGIALVVNSVEDLKNKFGEAIRAKRNQ